MSPSLCWRAPVSTALLLASSLLAGCVSHEAGQLVPSITLSPEDLELSQPADRSGESGGVDFGLTVSSNESDSLFNVEVLPGVRVREVAPGGPADLAGLQAGDVVLSVNGTEVNHPDTLEALARQSGERTDFTLRLRRGTAILESSLVGRPRASAGAPLRELFRADPLATRAGYETTVLQAGDGGEISAARVVEVAANSPLRAAGIVPGDVILALDGLPVESGQGLISRLLTDYELGDELKALPCTVTRRCWSVGSGYGILAGESVNSPCAPCCIMNPVWLISRPGFPYWISGYSHCTAIRGPKENASISFWKSSASAATSANCWK